MPRKSVVPVELLDLKLLFLASFVFSHLTENKSPSLHTCTGFLFDYDTKVLAVNLC